MFVLKKPVKTDGYMNENWPRLPKQINEITSFWTLNSIKSF